MHVLSVVTSCAETHLDTPTHQSQWLFRARLGRPTTLPCTCGRVQCAPRSAPQADIGQFATTFLHRQPACLGRPCLFSVHPLHIGPMQPPHSCFPPLSRPSQPGQASKQHTLARPWPEATGRAWCDDVLSEGQCSSGGWRVWGSPGSGSGFTYSTYGWLSSSLVSLVSGSLVGFEPLLVGLPLRTLHLATGDSYPVSNSICVSLSLPPCHSV